MADAPSDLTLDSVRGAGYPLRDWLTSYPLLMVALDPYTHESAWILETAGKLLRHYQPANIRVCWLVTADDEGCKQFLGPWEEEFLTFADPEREAVTALGLERLPSLIHVRSDGLMHTANGWDPTMWRNIAEVISPLLHWSRPMIPSPGDPVPFAGTPVAG